MSSYQTKPMGCCEACGTIVPMSQLVTLTTPYAPLTVCQSCEPNDHE
jgi:hypothetical protein